MSDTTIPSRRIDPQRDGDLLPDRPDAGFTLIEMLVVIVLLALVAGAVSAAVTIIFRTGDGAVTRTAEAHDLQQAVNFFVLDVESGPSNVKGSTDTSGWVVTGETGSGCSETGSENLFRYDVADLLRYDGVGARRVAYRLVTSGSSTHLDRYVCTNSSGVWVEESVVNIADELPSASSAVVSMASTGDVVERVTLEFDQTVEARSVSATPQPGQSVADLSEPCTDNPLDGTVGFQTMIEGDVTLNGGVLEGSLAVGGTLRWADGVTIPIASSNTNGAPFSNVALYAPTVDFEAGGSNGIITTESGSSKVVAVGTTSGDWYWVEGGPGNPALVKDKVYADETAYTLGVAHIETVGSVILTTDASLPTLTFSTQFTELRQCSDSLARLPYGAVAEHVVPLDPVTKDAYSGTGDIMLRFVDDANGDKATAVLNIPESELTGVGVISLENGSSLSASRSLIVNVDDDDGDGDVVFDFSSSDWSAVGDAKFVLFNFPNAHGTVTIAQDAYGVVFAPFAHVVTQGEVQAQIVAASWEHSPAPTSAGVVRSGSEYKYNSTITWL